MDKLLKQRYYNYKIVFAFIAVSLMILVGFISVWNEQSLSSSYLRNPLPNYACKAVPLNLNARSGINGNLTIISKGLINGSAWTASIEDKNYTTNQSFLKISLPIGNYTIKFHSSERYGQSRTVDLNTSGISIIENFYRMVNLSCSLNSFPNSLHVDSAGNLTMVAENRCVELYNHSNGLSRQYIPVPSCLLGSVSYICSSGGYFLLGGNNCNGRGISIVTFNPYGNYMNSNGPEPFSVHHLSSSLAGYSLNSMSAGDNEIFISGTRDSGRSYNIFGVVNLTSWEYTNITGEFSETNSSGVTSYFGNGSFIVGTANDWYILNGKSLSAKLIEGIGNAISPSTSNSGGNSENYYAAYNGSAFFIGNGSRIVCYNPVKNLTKSVYSVSNSMRISLIYANDTSVLAGIYNSSGNFSIAAITSKNENVPFFETTKADSFPGQNIKYMVTYGNSIIFIGPNLIGRGGTFYIFTDESFGITFKEYGLPHGLSWTVQIGKLFINSTNSCIQIDNLSSGIYYYYIGSFSNFNSSLSSGHFCYSEGIPINIFVSFNLRFTFLIDNLTMNPGFGELKIKLNGLNISNSGSSVINHQFNGKSHPIMVSDDLMYGKYSYYAIYTQSFTKAISGFICVNQNSSYKVLNFVRAKSIVTFSMENNISSQYCWNVHLSTPNQYCCGTNTGYLCNQSNMKGFGKENISTELRDGFYQYSVELPSRLFGQDGHNVIYGNFCVGGNNFSINVTFLPKYPVSIGEEGLHKYNIPHFCFLSPWSFTIYQLEGNRSSEIYNDCYINQPRGAVLCLPNGTYVGQAIQYCRQYNTITKNETFVVNGSSLNFYFHFIPYTYSVSVNESGLNGPYKWYINSSFGNYCGLAGRPITIYEVNGTYTFTATTNTKTYIRQQYIYTGCLWGINKTYNITFVRSVKVKVVQTGIPDGYKWYLNLTNQRPLCSVNSSAVVYYPAGTFDFTATSGANIYSTYLMNSHTFTVVNNSVLYLKFNPYNYSMNYEARYSGDINYNYSIILDGGYSHLHKVFYSNASFNVSFELQNGTYNYTAVSSNNAFINVSGTLYVQGFDYHGISLYFRLFLFNETFIVRGLKNNVKWGLTIRGENNNVYHLFESGSSGTFELHNGTYYLTANTSSGIYYSNAVNRTYIINSTDPVIKIKFYAVESFVSQLLNLYGSTDNLQYSTLLFIGIIIACSGIAYMRKKQIDR